MLKSHLVQLLEDSGLSPEQLGTRMGVSGMTVRRWIAQRKSKDPGRLYEAALRDATYRLVTEGLLNSSHSSVRKILGKIDPLPQMAALSMLGVAGSQPASAPEDQSGPVLEALSQIGGQKDRQNDVHERRESISSARKFGAAWAERIDVLQAVLRSRNLILLEKYPAIGALAYLVFIFDLIPDTIPVFGFLDDFSVLGIAATFYLNRSAKGNEGPQRQRRKDV